MNDVNECRICLDGNTNEELLIRPCKCNTAYVHPSCLQTWRMYNVNNNKYIMCEVCRTPYNIIRRYETETFNFELQTMPCITAFLLYVFILLGTSLFFFIVDILCKKCSFDLLLINNQTKPDILIQIDMEALHSMAYYISYTSYLFGMLFSFYIFYATACCVHQRLAYWQKSIFNFTIYFLLQWGFFYNFYLFYKLNSAIVAMYIVWAFMMPTINFMSMRKYCIQHNEVIKMLNVKNQGFIMDIGILRCP